jgi:hypothetical protein
MLDDCFRGFSRDSREELRCFELFGKLIGKIALGALAESLPNDPYSQFSLVTLRDGAKPF